MPDIFAQLRDLYADLARLDEERAAVSAKIAGCMNTLSETPAAQPLAASPPPIRPLLQPSFREQIYRIVASMPGLVITPWDVAQRLGIRGEAELNLMRGNLARLAKQGMITRISHGRYMAI